MSWKFLLPLLTLSALLLLAFFVPWQPVIGTDDRIVQFSFVPEPTNASCAERAEVRALKQLGDPRPLQNFHNALLGLYDESLDPLWQPLREVISPKTIFLDPQTLSLTDTSSNAIAINRFTRRLDLYFPTANQGTLKLSYRIGLRADHKTNQAQVFVSLDQQQEGPSAVLELQQLNDDMHLEHRHISNCAASALLNYFPQQRWVQGQSVEAGYCRLQSESSPQWRYYFACGTANSAATAAQ
ncbi:MAG TPA: hypothetical protein DCS87_01925 [Rheinheimera sp.]|nr:hypothetical protein [Rheinheimera sp.]